MSYSVVWQPFDGQLSQPVACDEFLKAVRRYHGHGGDVDLNIGEGGSIDRFFQQVFGKRQSAGLPAQSARSDPCEAKGAIPEVPVERGKVGNHSLEIGHCSLPAAII